MFIASETSLSEVSASPRRQPAEVVPADTGPTHWYVPYKAMADFVLTVPLLLLAMPVLLLAALAVKLTSRGPVFYSQLRLGLGGRPFRLYKLRSMNHECEHVSGPRWATPGDPRVTPVGRLLRFTHLDELPQLWNILRGEMSLVGPRPERPEFVPHLVRAVVGYRERLQVRPGLTGLAQVQLPADTDLDSVRRKLAYDLFYVGAVSPWLDLRILAGTALRAVGVPFIVVRVLFWLPDPGSVQRTYQGLCASLEVEARPA
jgi:lipopolysaccharide/colanic/teichoic acid biosynthesis glycosyltransferase